MVVFAVLMQAVAAAALIELRMNHFLVQQWMMM